MKSPTACLNEVLLSAALRLERVNADREADRLARDLAKRNDQFAVEFHRVPNSASPKENAHERAASGT